MSSVDNVESKTDTTSSGSRSAERSLFALRGNAFGSIVMLLVQYGLGLWVNLKLAVPGSDSGAGFWSGFIDAITRGPVALSLHAILGTLLILSAVALVIRAVRLRSPMWTVLAAVGLVAILLAWITGVRFVVTGDTEATLLMGLMTAIALFCYAVIVYAVIVFTSTFADRSRR